MFRSPSFRAAMVIGVLLLGMTVGFFQALATAIDHRAQDNLEQQWAAMKGYLRIEKTPTHVSPFWYLDSDDQDEVSAVSRIQRHFLLADREGRPLELSKDYPAIHADSPPEIRGRVRDLLSAGDSRKVIWLSRRNAAGEPFLVRAGVLFSEASPREPYYAAIATPIGQQRRLLWALTFGLLLVVSCAVLLGWNLGRHTLARAR